MDGSHIWIILISSRIKSTFIYKYMNNIVNVPQHKFQLFLNRLEGSLYQINFGIGLPDIVWNYSRVNKIST
jgi:hypothetical protein